MAVDFPSYPQVGQIWQNPATGLYYEWDGKDWNVKCLEGQTDCDPTGTWTNFGEKTSNQAPISPGFYWRIIPPDNQSNYEVTDSTKIMLSVDEYLPLFTDGEPSRIFLNDTPFVVVQYDVSGGKHHTLSLYGNQRDFFEDPDNATVDYKFCDGDSFVTFDQFKQDQERQDNLITELEEEFENLLPSLDRGSWIYSEDFTKPPGKFGFRTAGGGIPTDFADAGKIIFNKTDNAGEPHGFGDIKPDSYIQLFQDGDPKTAIYQVTADPVQSGDEFIIDIIFVRSEGTYPDALDDELFRFKFYEIAGADPGAYVLKTGDTLTGSLLWNPVSGPDNDEDFIGILIRDKASKGGDVVLWAESGGGSSDPTLKTEIVPTNDEDITNKKHIDERFDFRNYTELS